jgi:nucleotide-binding universal stress UspA family protein
MIEIARILAPIDFSEVSAPAFAYAAAIARWYGARITALHVFVNRPAVNIVPSPYPSTFAPLSLEGITDDVVRHLDGLIERAGASDVAIDRMVQEGPDASAEILAQAAAVPADLIVIGTHGRGGFDHLVLGSVAEKVLRKARCPVLVVPKQAHEAPRHAPVQFRRILCAVDFSEPSIAALEYAMSLAEEADARLTLLHATELPHGIREDPWSLDVDAVRARLEMDSTLRLQDLVPEAVRTFCTVETVVTEGKASREILRLASERESDVIVMGVRGRGAVDLMVFGSNTHAVIRHATCPVLTVRRE